MPEGALTPLSTKRIEANTAYELMRVLVSADDKFVYALGRRSSTSEPGKIWCYTRASSGLLTLLQEISMPSHYPGDMVIAPSGEFLYALGITGMSVIGYKIATDGKLTEIGTITWGTEAFCWSLVISPDGKNIYVGREGDFGKANQGAIVKITVNTSTGAMSGAEIFRDEAKELFCTRRLAMSPDGAHIFAADNANDTSTKIARIARNTSTGALSLTTLYTASKAAIEPKLNPKGTFLYVSLVGGSSAQYSVAESGALTPLTPETFTAGGGLQVMASEGNAYTGAGESVAQWSYNGTTGILTALSPETVRVEPEASGYNVYTIAVTKDKKSVYVSTNKGYVYEFEAAAAAGGALVMII